MSLAEATKSITEEILRYDALPQRCFETPLLQDLKSRFAHIEVFAPTFQRAAEVARHLGRWCADAFLLHALSPEKSRRYSVEVEKKWHARKGTQKLAELDQAVEEVQHATDYIQQQSHVLDEFSWQSDLSSKVHQLDRYLRMQFERESNHRAIVFVDRRYTARLLHILFTRLRGKVGTDHLKGHFLVGSNGGGIDEDSVSFKQQVLTLIKFRKGELNCLFATSVAEEGLDVPDCNLVVRFDMYNTMIQYIQSRGRARNQNSKFIHMVEKGNCAHQQTLGEVRWQETSMRRFCDQLPEDRKLQGTFLKGVRHEAASRLW